MPSLVHQMLAAERRAARARKTLGIAIALSLALHALLLFFPGLRAPRSEGSSDSNYFVQSPLQARLNKRAAQATPAQAPTAAKETAKRNQPRTQSRVITSKKGNWSVPARPEAPAPAPSGAELARRALAMARGMVADENAGGTDAISTRQEGKGTEIEPFSLQYYFDSFINKMNRSARFVPREPRPQGRRKALVKIIINSDGSLRDYQIVQAADRQAEIDYIKAVVERAAPFAAFPPDIRKKTDTLQLMMCIDPPGEGGFGFTRTSSLNC